MSQKTVERYDPRVHGTVGNHKGYWYDVIRKSMAEGPLALTGLSRSNYVSIYTSAKRMGVKVSLKRTESGYTVLKVFDREPGEAVS